MKRFLLGWILVTSLVIGVAIFCCAEGWQNAAFVGLVVFVFVGKFVNGKYHPTTSDTIKHCRDALSCLLLPKNLVERRNSIIGLLCVIALTAILLPPWTARLDTYRFRHEYSDGFGLIFLPPSAKPYESVRIDFGRLALELVAISLSGGVILLLFGSAGTRSNHSQESREENAKQIMVEVLTGFQDVARKRGESLTESQLKRISLYFLHQQNTFGSAFTREHLAYELVKYEREGLRTSYQS